MWRIILLIYLSKNVECSVFVETNVGVIEGLEATDGDYNMFMGIPYATIDPANPFGEVIPFPTFDSIFQAFDDSAICPQREEFNNTITGILDCLHVNIYVPKTASDINKLPVLVSIHGGTFTIGFSGRFTFGPKFLVSHDIILVTFNYRLGVYGFMCLDTPEVPGNQGLKDQQLALEWIYNNIEYFGGDRNAITIFGQSAGSMSLDLHLLSPHEKIYDKVIFQAGTALNPGVIRDSDVTAPLRIAEHLGFVTTDLNDALAFMSEVNSDSLIETVEQLNMAFRPCVEKDFGQTRFIPDHPVNLDRAKVRDVDVLLGYTEFESLITVANLNDEDYETLAPFSSRLDLAFNFDLDRMTDMERIIRQFYIGDKLINSEILYELTNFYSDLSFGYTSTRAIKIFIDDGARSVFQYIFSYSGERNYVKAIHNITVPGAAHNDEIGYLFDVSFLPENILPEDQLIIDRMTTLFANFVKYGNPTPATTDLIPVPWLSVTTDTWHFININTELTTGMKPFHDRYAFWEIFYELNKEYEIGYNINSANSLPTNSINVLVVTVIIVMNIF